MHITTDAVYERYTDEGCATRYTPLVDPGNSVCSPVPALLGAPVGDVMCVSRTASLVLFRGCCAD